MKSLPGSLKLLIIAAMGTGVIVGVRALADCNVEPQGEFRFKVERERQAKNEDTFSDVFDHLSSGAQYCFHMRHSPGHKGHGKYKDKTEYDITNMSGASKASNQLDIRTDKVIVSQKAAGVSEDLTAITTHTTVQIASPSNSDITAIKEALK